MAELIPRAEENAIWLGIRNADAWLYRAHLIHDGVAGDAFCEQPLMNTLTQYTDPTLKQFALQAFLETVRKDGTPADSLKIELVLLRLGVATEDISMEQLWEARNAKMEKST